MPRILTALCAAISLVVIAASPASSAEIKIFGSRVTKMIVDTSAK